MNKEDKELLLKDLCARLPYGVKVKCPHWDYERDDDFITIETLIGIDNNFLKTKDEKGNIDSHSYTVPLSPLKPYLRPMSSMTEEEKRRLETRFSDFNPCWVDGDGCITFAGGNDFLSPDDLEIYFDFLNEHHFDYRGLIEKGLALEAPEGMYKIE